MRRTLPYLLIALLGFLPASSTADLSADLDRFYKGSAFANTTVWGAYTGQTTDFFTAGGVTWRVPARTYNLYSIQLPRLRMGCGGIDLFTGGFSFINSDQLVAMLRSIGSAALSYGLMIAIKIISPEAASIIEELQKWAQKANQMNISSCEAARNLISGAFRTVAGKEWGCISTKLMAGDSYQTAKEACGPGGEAATTDAPPEEKKNLPMTRGNIAWKAIMENGPFGSDYQLAQAAMSLSGTVVISPDPKNPTGSKRQVFPSIVGNGSGEKLINAMLYGGRATVYACNDGYGPDQCLDVKNNLTVDIRPGLVNYVYNNILKLAIAIYYDSDVSKYDKKMVAFIDAATIPIYRYMTTLVAAGGPNLAIHQAEYYSEYIAREMLISYIHQTIIDVTTAVMQTRNNADDPAYKQFMQNAARALRLLEQRGRKIMDQLRTRMAMNEEILLYQRMLASRVPAAMFRAATPATAASVAR